MKQSLTTYGKQAVDYVQPYAQAAAGSLLDVVKKTPLPERLKNLTQKELTLAAMLLSWALFIEKECGIPLCSGIPQMIGFIFTTIAYVLDKFATTTDPDGNSAAVYSGGLAAGYLLYLCYNKPRTTPADNASLPASATNNDETATPIVP